MILTAVTGTMNLPFSNNVYDITNQHTTTSEHQFCNIKGNKTSFPLTL